MHSLSSDLELWTQCGQLLQVPDFVSQPRWARTLPENETKLLFPELSLPVNLITATEKNKENHKGEKLLTSKILESFTSLVSLHWPLSLSFSCICLTSKAFSIRHTSP